MSFDSITNRGEFFSNHYLDAIIAGDLGDLRSQWDEQERAHKDTARSRVRGLAKPFFNARADAKEASESRRPDASRALNSHVLEALGYTVDRKVLELVHTTANHLRVPVAGQVETGAGLLLVALDAGLADDVDDIFDIATNASAALLEPVVLEGEKKELRSPADAVAAIFATDEPPRWVLVVAGRIVLLAERARWSEGRFLAVDLDIALERNDTRKAGELETIAALFSTDALVPTEGQAVIDDLTDRSTKHAVGVSKDLREGIRRSIEILANEVIKQQLARTRVRHDPRFKGDRVDPKLLTTQCLRYLFRMLVLLYAESRPELGIVPIDDEVYQEGYSLDRLRELVLVDLDTDEARNGSHLDESLNALFELVNQGYHAEHAEQMLDLFGPDRHATDDVSYEEYLQFPGLDAQLFDTESTSLLDEVPLRNEPLQQVLRLLMLSPEGKKGNDSRGFISYAQLGINQLGAVYEGLMAYTGFYAHGDLFEVAKGGDPSDGTWVLPVADAGGYPDEVFVTHTDPLTGAAERVRHPDGSFVFRLSGRDRQRSASYYTPEVLTRCVVKHALAELLGLDDYAPENGSSGITNAIDILDLTICEPALGSGAFANEAINQLSAVYLQRRQAELGETLDPERYARELQKLKAHFALHQTYGVDLNATAVELAEVSLWLNCMHPGLKAPWFGLQLRRGNSLVGCRRATWRASQLPERPWAETKRDKLRPPVDRPLNDPRLGELDPDEIHHFLLPGHGWAAVADRAEAKEFRPERAKSLREWRKQMLKAPKRSDAERLTALAGGVERLWAAATERIRLTQQALRRPIEVWGGEQPTGGAPVSRQKAIEALENPDSALGRLRTVMDAWVGLWFWELDADASPPTWTQWLDALEALIDPDAALEGSGQLDVFADLAALLDADEREEGEKTSVAAVKKRFPWLAAAVHLAREEGAWHWTLEFAPQFVAGGFDLQVGNPPWVKLEWKEADQLADYDPLPVLAALPGVEQRSRRAAVMQNASTQAEVLSDLAGASGVVALLRDVRTFPLSSEGSANLYLSFIEVAFRNARAGTGTAALVNQEIHLTTPDMSALRRAFYRRCRRHFHFRNEKKLFDEVKNNKSFSVNIWANPDRSPDFLHGSWFFQPSTIDESLVHDGAGPVSGIKTASGEWDTRPHRDRIMRITTNELGAFAGVLGDDDVSAARLMLPLSLQELDGIRTIGKWPASFRTVDPVFDHGIQPDGALASGAWIDEQVRPSTAAELVLMAGHMEPGSWLAQEPHQPFRSSRDFVPVDLERIPAEFLPVSNYRKLDLDIERSLSFTLDGEPVFESWRMAWRRRIDQGGVRILSGALVPPGVTHNHSVHAIAGDAGWLAETLGVFISIPSEYLARSLARDDLTKDAVGPLPLASLERNRLSSPIRLRSIRIAALTVDFMGLWSSIFEPVWRDDSWVTSRATVGLGDLTAEFSSSSGLRREFDRRQAQLEIDCLVALMLGLESEQLCAMYRTQFPVLRKYERAMAFDADGRRICGHHQAAGRRQGDLQQQAKDGLLPSEWKSIWTLFEQWEEDADSVDWLGHYCPPFYRPNREAEMTAAYNEFKRRLDAGEYGS